MSQLILEVLKEGVILPVQAQPKARRNGLNGVHAGRLKVQVTQAPEKGKANQAIIELLAKTLSVSKSQVRLLAGETSSQKKFLVSGVTVDQLQRAIQDASFG